MSNQWESYFTRVGENLASVRIDLTFTNPEFRPDFLNTLLYVWVKLQAPNENGLTTDEEAQRLLVMEDKLIEFLGAEYGGVPVGVVTTDGRREFYFYGESGDDLHNELKPVLGEFPDYAFQFGHKSDPQWEHYFGFLFPSPTEFQWMQDVKIVTQLEEQGDPLTPRPVQHWLYFRTAEGREAVKNQLAAQGFTIEEESEHEQAFVLSVTRIDAVDLGSIHNVTAPLTMLALENDGEYDGWETMVVQK
ncbi:DUF695 domain-containing protein [Tumebacillus flagellatus]|uniref:Uncharacterized protein n=1 Tax=Tumebacillus flagellatus TaxID=1157490 RepID=A0A074LSL9_9BACL|nr:DUF695 domain-containing protein [Tumebacillus flagellatus]KEO82798.1 hypothetical protein EL26_13700 [Tumebacillus flagellatus]